MPHWILRGHEPVPTDDMLAWGVFFENIDNRRVAETIIPPGVRVSTVFLGIDHNFKAHGPPILFETMVFDDRSAPEIEEMQRRYATWDEAVASHYGLVAEVYHRLGIPDPPPSGPPRAQAVREPAPTAWARLLEDDDD